MYEQKWNSLLACVRACMWASIHFYSACSFLLWHSCDFFCLHNIFIYIYIPYMFVYINYYYLYIYFKCFLITRVRARATLLTTNNLHRKPMRWLFFGLVGRQPFFITLSACLFFTVFSISVTLFFIFLSRSRNARVTNAIDFPSRA